ncbi:tyrosine-type recombinase/integrase [Lentzea sp. NPDC054927]
MDRQCHRVRGQGAAVSRRGGQAGLGCAADVAWQECGLLFTTRHGTPIEPRNFNRSWDRRCENGVPKITVHDGRRSCASLLAELNVHPRVIMRILRHANMEVTMEIYTEVSAESTRKALQQLSGSLGI